MAFARKHQADHRRGVLSNVEAAGSNGLLIEKDRQSSTYDLLVEDGFLTHAIAHGTARTYWRYRLTDTGRAALAMKEAS